MQEINRDLTRIQRIALGLVWAMCRIFSVIPMWVQYHVISPMVYMIVYKIFRYRVDLVDENLSYAFADKSEKERREIRRKFYRNLSDVFISTVAIASPNMKGKFDDVNDPCSEAAQLRKAVRGKNWIGLTSHFGLWEHLMFWGEYSDQYIVGAYHKLKDPVSDALFMRLRCRNHKRVIAVERKQMARFCIKHRNGIDGKSFGIGLLSDQNPTRYANSQWIDFLGRETIFFEGGEALALKLGFPVYFVYQKRGKRGEYKLAYELLYDGVESVEPFEITRRYVRRLEAEIRECPELWLWSHRRWKHKRDE